MEQAHTRWIAVAVALFLVGGAAAWFSGRAVATNDARASRQLSQAAASDIASKLKLAIQHEEDLVVTTSSYFVRFPSGNQSEFRLWMASLHAFKRYPELQGLAEVVFVKRSGLAQFETNALLDPAGTIGPNHTFGLTPPGSRPYYCLAEVEMTRLGAVVLPAGLDFCDTPLGPLFMKARDTGLGAYLPSGSGNSEGFVVGSPVYSSGNVPKSVAARRTHFIGWVGTQIKPHVLLATALEGHSQTFVKFTYGTGASAVTFRAGTAPIGAVPTNINLRNGWRLQTFEKVEGNSLWKNGNAIALFIGGLLLSFLLGAIIFLLGTGRSRAIELVRERTNELEHLALHDPLTGLPNRVLIQDRVSQMNARARRDHTNVAVLFLDLDNFKEINDTLGHSAGDELLVQVGSRLSSALRDGDTVGRLGGDEFVILADAPSLMLGAETLASRVMGALQTPFKIHGSDKSLTVTASIGIAEGSRAEDGDMLRDADIAMYHAKESGKRQAVMFLPSMQAAMAEQRSLNSDLEHSLANREYFLLYQPIINLETNEVLGVEALLRWRHPTKGVVTPDLFIPALEANGLITSVGRWVIDEACRQSAMWRDIGLDLTMSVNVSARQLENDDIISEIKNAIKTNGLAPERLILELTETALMRDLEATLMRLRALKKIGVRIAIDDFGTGYSSLSYLSQFPIDVLKIDRSFVSGVPNDAEATTLVHTLVELGRALGITTVAEGIETQMQLDQLTADRADFAQGFLISHPISGAEIQAFLENRISDHQPVVQVI